MGAPFQGAEQVYACLSSARIGESGSESSQIHGGTALGGADVGVETAEFGAFSSAGVICLVSSFMRKAALVPHPAAKNRHRGFNPFVILAEERGSKQLSWQPCRQQGDRNVEVVISFHPQRALSSLLSSLKPLVCDQIKPLPQAVQDRDWVPIFHKHRLLLNSQTHCPTPRVLCTE